MRSKCRGTVVIPDMPCQDACFMYTYRDGKPEKRRTRSVPDAKPQCLTMADFSCVLHQREYM